MAPHVLTHACNWGVRGPPQQQQMQCQDHSQPYAQLCRCHAFRQTHATCQTRCSSATSSSAVTQISGAVHTVACAHPMSLQYCSECSCGLTKHEQLLMLMPPHYLAHYHYNHKLPKAAAPVLMLVRHTSQAGKLSWSYGVPSGNLHRHQQDEDGGKGLRGELWYTTCGIRQTV